MTMVAQTIELFPQEVPVTIHIKEISMKNILIKSIFVVLCLVLWIGSIHSTPLKANSAGDILITPPLFDDIGQILTDRFGLAQGTHWIEIENVTLQNYDAIKNAKTIFINCSSDSLDQGSNIGDSLRRFVDQGGTLYASDWAYTYIETSFPGYLAFLSPDPLDGQSGTITATVLDQGLRNYLFGASTTTTINIDYDLSAWAVIDQTLRSDVKVLMTGDVPLFDGLILPNHPLAVTFPYGQGRVVYTTFHNEAQQSDLEKRLLEYLVLLPTTTEIQSQVQQALSNANLFQVRQDLNKINQGETIQGFYTTTGKRGFGFGLGWSGSTLRLSVYRPNGSLFARREDTTSPFVLNVPKPDATAGTWRYEITAVSIPSNNYPLVVGIGVVPDKTFFPIILR